MKKVLAILLVIIVVVVTIVIYNYSNYKTQLERTRKLNEEYETFTNSEILGTSLISLINKAIDNNKKNNISLDDNNLYIENETTSLNIEVIFTESEEKYPMEKIERLGSEQFIKNYASATFKCTKKQYHEKTNNIKYLLFEQI